MEKRKIKYFKIGFYILSIFPLIFIFSSLIFYIYYGIILNFWGISGINPNEYPDINIFSYTIIYSWIITFFSILLFIPLFIMALNHKIFDSLKRNILVNSLLYLTSIILVFSKIFEFAID